MRRRARRSRRRAVVERGDAALQVQDARHRPNIDARGAIPGLGQEQRGQLRGALPVRPLRDADEEVTARVADVAAVERAWRLDLLRFDPERGENRRGSPRLRPPGSARTGPGEHVAIRPERTAVSSTNVASGCAGSSGSRSSSSPQRARARRSTTRAARARAERSGVPSETEVRPSAKLALGGRTMARVKRNDIRGRRPPASAPRSRRGRRWSGARRR